MYLYSKIKHYAIPELKKDLSDNTAKIVLMYSHLSPEETAFLNKMIVAYKWQPEDLLHLEINPAVMESYSNLWITKEIKILWLFDIEPESIGIFALLPKYQIYRLTNIYVYCTDRLSKIEMNKQLKTKVWMDLKDIKLD